MPLSPTRTVRRESAPAARGRQRCLERAQIAVVDADQPRSRSSARPVGSSALPPAHPCRGERVLERAGGRVVDASPYDQDAVRAPAARLGDLIGFEHEILAQHRQRRGLARRGKKFRRALKRRRVGEHRQAGRAARFIGFRQRRRIEIGADQTLGRRLAFLISAIRPNSPAATFSQSRAGSRAPARRPWHAGRALRAAGFLAAASSSRL